MSATVVDATKPPFRMIAFGAGVQSIAMLYAWIFDSILMPREKGWEQLGGFFDGERPDLVVFAESLRAFVEANDPQSFWPHATRERLRRIDPGMYAYIEELFTVTFFAAT